MSLDTKDGELTPVPAPVNHALIMVCEKCGKKLATDPEQNPARALQLLLKETIKNNDGKGKLRAVITSCLDVCPKGEMTVGISWADAAGGKDRFFTVKGTDTPAMAINVLEKVLEGPSGD